MRTILNLLHKHLPTPYLSIIVVWGIGLFCIAWIGLQIIPHTDVNSTFGYPQRWSNWDGNNYIHIAMQGYEKTGSFSYAFFPLYPVIIYLFTYITHSYFGSAWIISITSFVLALIVLRKLLLLDYPEKTARDTILFLLLFPTAFYFFATYTESLFFFFVLLAMFSYRKDRFLISAIAAALATATRTNGIGLILYFLVEALFLKKEKSFRSFLPVVGPLFGLSVYMVYLYFTKGDPLYFHTIQQTEFFRTGIVLPIQPLIRMPMIWLEKGTDIFSNWLTGITFAEVLGSYFFLGLLVVGYTQKIRTSYLVFALFCWSLPLSTGITASMLRFFLILFPCFLSLALLFQNKPFEKYILLLLSTIGLILAVMYFHTGHWIA